jgi:hypothetical protein
MPFDATVLSVSNELADRLRLIGIREVHLNVVNEHKARVIRDFSRSLRGRGLVRSGAAAWRTLHMYRNLDILECPRREIGPTIDVSPAPAPINDLARRVSRELADAEFELEWFYTDPVLNVYCGGQKACLGIWDDGRIVAIAEHEGYVPAPAYQPPQEPLWRRWIGRLWSGL